MKNIYRSGAALLLCTALSACYVVPATSGSRVMTVPNTPVPVQAQVSLLQAKLYPTNPAAQRYGAVQARVSTDQSGHGAFTAYIGGETFSGDATRMSQSHQGRANGAAPSGRYISCEYEMNSPQLGRGSCRMSDGAVFSMHISR